MATMRGGIAVALAMFWALSVGQPVLAVQGAADPEAALTQINNWYADQVKQARDKSAQPDFAALMKERTAKARAAVAGVDAATVEPSKALALAELYQIAGMSKECSAAAQRYLTSNPPPDKGFQAQTMVLAGYQEAGDAKALQALLLEMKPPTPQASALLALQAARSYGDVISEKLGPQAALDVLTALESKVQFGGLTGERDKQLGDFTVMALADARSGLLTKLGKSADASAALEDAIKRLGPDNQYAKSLQAKIALAKLVGSPAPELKRERGYGDFPGLKALRGKVVLIDFGAHW